MAPTVSHVVLGVVSLLIREELDDSPMREDALHLFCIRQFKRAQNEARGFELRDHSSIVAGRESREQTTMEARRPPLFWQATKN